MSVIGRKSVAPRPPVRSGDIMPLGGVAGMLEPPFRVGDQVFETRADVLYLLLGPEVARLVIPHLIITFGDIPPVENSA